MTLKEFCENKQTSAKQLAPKLGASTGVLEKIINHNEPLNQLLKIRLSKLTGIPVDQWF